MKKISSIFLLSLTLISFNSKGIRSQIIDENYKVIDTIKENKQNNLNLTTNNINDKNIEIQLTGIGYRPEIVKEISSKLITLNLKTSSFENRNSFQSLSIPSVGIKTLTVSGYEDYIKILITSLDQISLAEPEIMVSNNITGSFHFL